MINGSYSASENSFENNKMFSIEGLDRWRLHPYNMLKSS